MWRNWLRRSSPNPSVAQRAPITATRKVSLIIHNPRIPSAQRQPLQTVLGWHDPRQLARAFSADLHEVSGGYADFRLVEEIEVDDFPLKEDGFRYSADHYMRCWQERRGFHTPDWCDYQAILDEFDLVQKVNRGLIDEVWLMAFPYAGYYESRIIGRDGFWCNAPTLFAPQAQRRFIVMGFNYERGVGEMLESFGHRAESLMAHTYRHHHGEKNQWERFIRYDKLHPERAGVGNIHYAPNSDRDYDWGNRRTVHSCADDWFNYPHLKGEYRPISCHAWGNGDIRGHHRWWLDHLPKTEGQLDGVSNNWWEYIVDPNLVP